MTTVVHTVHVLPKNDLIEHEGEDCICGPRTEPVKRKDGSINWLVTHFSLGGRERYEPKGDHDA